MDIPKIGDHCSLGSCRVNDFLPIRCKCEQSFCKDHIFPDSHNCPFTLSGSDLHPSSSHENLQRCAFADCRKPSLEAFMSTGSQQDQSGRSAAICAGCKKSFCASHREPSIHDCLQAGQAGAPPAPKNQTARALLAKHFPSSRSPGPANLDASRAKPPTDPKKLAQIQQVQLIKMRHKAIPGDPRDKNDGIAASQRLYIQVYSSPDASHSGSPFWFRRTIVTGRALDLLASHLGATSVGEEPRYLMHVCGEQKTLLRNDLLLADQVADGSHVYLGSGSTTE